MVGIVVLGMHRSGTSTVGRLLTGLGLTTGGLTLASQAENPRGYFERYDVADINNRWLATMGGAWWAPPSISEGTWGRLNTKQIRRDRESLDILSVDHAPWFVKDPRLCLLLPLWDRMALMRLPAVIIVRDPREVASSIRLRDGMSERRALLLWYAYVHRSAEFARDRNVLVLDNAALLADPIGATKSLAQFVADNAGVATTELDLDAVGSLVEPQLNRQRPQGDGTVAAEHVQECLALYRTFADLHGEPSLPERIGSMPKWVSVGLEELSDMYQAEIELERVRQERDDLAYGYHHGWRSMIGAYRQHRRDPYDG